MSSRAVAPLRWEPEAQSEALELQVARAALLEDVERKKNRQLK